MFPEPIKDHGDYSIEGIFKNPIKSLGEKRRLTGTETPMKAHQLTLELKIC